MCGKTVNCSPTLFLFCHWHQTSRALDGPAFLDDDFLDGATEKNVVFSFAAAQDFHLEIMDTSWYIMSTSWFVSFRVFLMELFVHWNQCRYNPPSWDPSSPRHTPRSRMWNHLMFLKYMYKWKKWKKPVDSSHCRVLREQFWFTWLCECIINYLHIKTNSWWCRNPAPVEINSVNKDLLTACLHIFTRTTQPAQGFQNHHQYVHRKKIQPRHRFVCPRLPKQHDSAFQKKEKERKNILQSRKIWLKIKTPSSCC